MVKNYVSLKSDTVSDFKIIALLLLDFTRKQKSRFFRQTKVLEKKLRTNINYNKILKIP